MINESSVFWSRILTEVTLSFHIIYATLGVGVPIMIMIAQWVGIKNNDEHYILMARRWARGFVITVAVGVVTGTIYRLAAITFMAKLYANGRPANCIATIHGNICVLL